MMKTLVLLKAQRKDATGTLDLFAQPVFVEAYTKRDGTVVTAHVQKVHKKADKPKEGKSGRMSYAQAVSENMKHMGSKLEEWTAIPISGMEEVDAGDDRTVMMPMFDFSDTKNYKPAPSLFGGQSECCHLCGTPIKFHYWIKNDKKQWTMSVGSECVTKFGEGESGERLAKKAQWEQNRALLRDAIDARKRLFKKFGKKTWTGHLEISPYRAGESKGVDAYLGLRAATGRLHADESLTTGPASKDGPISAFAKRHGEKVREWIAIADEKAPREPPITKAMPIEAQKVRSTRDKPRMLKSVLFVV